jgi:hypothetical protein
MQVACAEVLVCCPQVSLSASVAFALSDTGQLFAWGGRDTEWRPVDAASTDVQVREARLRCCFSSVVQQSPAGAERRRCVTVLGCAVQKQGLENLTPRSKLLIGAAQAKPNGGSDSPSREFSLYEWGSDVGTFFETFDPSRPPQRGELLRGSDSENTSSDSDDAAGVTKPVSLRDSSGGGSRAQALRYVEAFTVLVALLPTSCVPDA